MTRRNYKAFTGGLVSEKSAITLQAFQILADNALVLARLDPVSYTHLPFHTRLMAPAGDALAKRFATENFGEMKTPVLFNCLGHEKRAENAIPALLEKRCV